MTSVPTLTEALQSNSYPGRGLVVTRLVGGPLVVGYFLTGRSPASQARTFLRKDAGLAVVPTDDTAHDELRHYLAATWTSDHCVVGNGDQVEVVAGRLNAGQPPAQALMDLQYEPDPPLYTSRITTVVSRDGGVAVLGAARHSAFDREAANVMAVTIAGLGEGEAVLWTTYQSSEGKVSTAAPYLEVTTDAGTAEDLCDQLWEALPTSLRVGAAVVSPAGGDAVTRARS